MAQMTIYMPDDLASQVKREAERAGKSVSAYLAEMARARLHPSRWPESFVKLSGRGLEGFPDLDDPPPDEIERLRTATSSTRTSVAVDSTCLPQPPP